MLNTRWNVSLARQPTLAPSSVPPLLRKRRISSKRQWASNQLTRTPLTKTRTHSSKSTLRMNMSKCALLTWMTMLRTSLTLNPQLRKELLWGERTTNKRETEKTKSKLTTWKLSLRRTQTGARDTFLNWQESLDCLRAKFTSGTGTPERNSDFANELSS